MSGYRTHLFGAVVSFYIALLIAGLWWQLTGPEIVLCAVFALLAGLWPDVDTKSVGQSLFYSLFFLFDVYLIWERQYKAAAYFGLIIMLPILGKHRGFTHTRWAAILIPGGLYLFYLFYQDWMFEPRTLVYPLSAICGYMSHLALDRKLL